VDILENSDKNEHFKITKTDKLSLLSPYSVSASLLKSSISSSNSLSSYIFNATGVLLSDSFFSFSSSFANINPDINPQYCLTMNLAANPIIIDDAANRLCNFINKKLKKKYD
jgi:hypothetical protein